MSESKCVNTHMRSKNTSCEVFNYFMFAVCFNVVLQFGAYKQTRVNRVSFIFIFSKIILPSVSINWLIIS
jgi:hypothetical protein